MGSGAGSFGSLSLNADGSYSYEPSDGAVNALGAGTTADSFTVTVSDGTLTDTRVIAITVVGVNDAPIASDTYTHTVTDTTAADTFAAITGSLTASDAETTATS